MFSNEDPDHWNEFDWELHLRDGDRYADRYFRLMQRFSDLPGSKELIAKHLGSEFAEETPDCDFDCEKCSQRWQCDYALPLDWSLTDEDFLQEHAENHSKESFPASESEPGDALFYEQQPAFVTLRQTAMGWCNIYATVLSAKTRLAGLRVLYHSGRSLAYLAYSIGDGLYEQPAASVSFAKRSLWQLNQAAGGLNILMEQSPRLKNLLQNVRTQMLASREQILRHLASLRKGMASGDSS